MHLTEDRLERLLLGELSGPERREGIRHLLERCPHCLRAAQAVAERRGLVFLFGRSSRPRGGTEGRGKYDLAFARLERHGEEMLARIEKEQRLASAQWVSLQKHSQARRLTIVASDPKMRTWGLYHKLLQVAREMAPSRPERAMETAQLALAVAERLDPSLYGAERIVDFQAAALAVLGNCKRVAEDFEGARTDLARALDLLPGGTGDPLERAAVLSLQGSWYTDLGYFEEAAKLFARAIRIYQRAGDDSNVGRTMLKQASALGYLDPDRAIEILDEASDHINSITEPRLELSLRHSLAVFLNDAGRIEEAEGVLEDSRSLYAQFPDAVIQLRLRWLEGRLSRSLDDLRKAQEIFARTAADFLKQELLQEHLLCSLDLAEACYEQGDRSRTLQICSHLYSALESWHMHSEGLAVMLLFVEALQEDTLEKDAFVNLSRYLRRAWYRPQQSE